MKGISNGKIFHAIIKEAIIYIKLLRYLQSKNIWLLRSFNFKLPFEYLINMLVCSVDTANHTYFDFLKRNYLIHL